MSAANSSLFLSRLPGYHLEGNLRVLHHIRYRILHMSSNLNEKAKKSRKNRHFTPNFQFPKTNKSSQVAEKQAELLN